MRKLIRRLKTIAVDLLADAMNWNFSHVIQPAKFPSFRDRFGRFIDDKLQRLFFHAYQGSEQEIDDGIEFAIDNLPDHGLTALQREIKHRLCEFVDVKSEESR